MEMEQDNGEVDDGRVWRIFHVDGDTADLS